ncbi:MAG TPA: hypothetical protein VMH04_19235 [Candidatus Solibacter sp.]|nr:hypothetical protein [Candidatus Solibacter sp.]
MGTSKKVGNSKTGSKKTKTTTTKDTAAKKEMNPAEVRRDISQIVMEGAVAMAQAVVDEAKKGQLVPTKYLLELAGVFPANTDGSVATDEEDCLAKTLLQRLNLPTEPVKLDEDDDEDEVVVPADAKGEPLESSGETVETGRGKGTEV